ncbi:hypothetical protein ACR5KS_08920 [Leucobacter sp. W1153]|uniref:hypothetical protein n=1 Tax=Leucobacter sp. W1153 TaxID=3439064 RepID=UPI003F328B7D
MNTVKRRTRSDAGRRTFGGRTLVALVAAAALTLGPGALAVYADDSAPVDPGATTEVAPVAPAVDPAPTPEPPAPEPAPEPELPAPAPEPPAPEPAPPAPAPDPEPAAPPTGEPTDSAEPTPETDEAAPEESRIAEEPAPVDESDLDDETAKNGNDNPQNMIKLCHATGSEKNPWVMLMLNANGVISGHASQHESDIIPPFEYKNKGKPAYFAGQNLTEGNLAIWNNDCEEIKPPPPNPVVQVTVDQCVTPYGEVPGSVEVAVSSLVNKFTYTLVVTGPGGSYFETPLNPAEGGASVWVDINGPGSYVATVTGVKSKHDSSIEKKPSVTVTGSQEFFVNECPRPPKPPKPEQPMVTVWVDQCVPPNGVVPSSVAITVTKLNHKFNYWMEVTGPDFSESVEVTPGEDGTFFIDLPVPSPGDYVATVTGTRGGHGGGHEWPDDTEIMFPSDSAAVQVAGNFERPRHGGKVVLTGTANFTVNPDCAVPPPASVTPTLPITSSPPPMQALAVTGAPADGSNAAMALLLLLGAGAALLATGARRVGRSRL